MMLSIYYIDLVVACDYIERDISGFGTAAEVVWQIADLVTPCGDHTVGIAVIADIKRRKPSGVSGIKRGVIHHTE